MTRATVVLFDLDGTLTDSRLGILRTTRYAFSRLSKALGREVALPGDDQLGSIVGPPLRNSFAKLAGAENVETLMGFYSERYREIGAFENEVYEGIPEALDALIATGARLFVATSKNRDDALRILAHFGLDARFEAIHGAREDGGLADKTELIGSVLASHALDPGRMAIAMIGDRKFDIVGARNCAIAAMGALWGYGGREELREAGAQALLASPSEVAAAVGALTAPRGEGVD
jgi:phosphoglycolate phosphatase